MSSSRPKEAPGANDPATRGAALPPRTRRSDLFLIPAVICVLGLLSVALVLWMDRLNDLRRGHLLLVEAIMDVQLRAATFHFKLEEHLQGLNDGAPAPEIREVWTELDRARGIMATVLRDGLSKHGIRLGALEAPGLRAEAEAVDAGLQLLRDIAGERVTSPPASPIGLALDRRVHDVYHEVQQRSDALHALAENLALRSSDHGRRVAALLYAIWALIVGVAALGLLRHQRARLLAETELRTARADLERANLELEARVREKTHSLQEANAALTDKVAECGRAHEALLGHQDRLRDLTSQLTLAEERERRRIATELHDRIGTALAFAKMKLAALPAPAAAGAGGGPRELEEGVALIEQAIEDARSLTLELSAPALYELGLEPALEWLAERTQREHHLPVEVRFGPCPEPLDEDVRVLVFRAIRELLVNVVKHARATRARIECRQEGDDLWIAVEDDGVGFQGLEAGQRPRGEEGFGLFSIRERLGSLGGAVEVESGAAGSRVILLVPLRPGAKGKGDA